MSRRNTSLALLLGLFALALGASPALARGSSGPAITARAGIVDSATLSQCNTGATPADRTARFSATMQSLPRTRSMAISFDLFERSPGGQFTQVPDPGFGSWQASNPRVTNFTANEDVLDLPAPGSFRAVVHYRWFNARHKVIRIDRRVTPPCVERAVPTPLPDLAVASITHAPGSPPATTEDYTVTVANAGKGDAGSFEVAFSVGGNTLPAQTVSGLAAGTSTTVLFTGPRCTAGSTLTATIDPSGSISEPPSQRRTVSIQCPSGGGGGGGGGGSTGKTGTSGSSGSSGAK